MVMKYAAIADAFLSCFITAVVKDRKGL